jgi:hypothetical protein
VGTPERLRGAKHRWRQQREWGVHVDDIGPEATDVRLDLAAGLDIPHCFHARTQRVEAELRGAGQRKGTDLVTGAAEQRGLVRQHLHGPAETLVVVMQLQDPHGASLRH